MQTIKDWVSCQLISKSVLAARPFSFSQEEPENEHSQGVTVATRLPESASTNTLPESASTNTLPESASTNTVFNQEQGPSYPQFTAEAVPCASHVKTTHFNKDPYAQIESLQVNFLRLVLRLGLSPENIIVSQVLYRLQLATLIRASESDVKRARFIIDNAKISAARKENSNETDLDLSLKILVLGKTGVGKSATINSIFNQQKTTTSAFEPATNHIQEVVGTVKGVKVTIVDTPGLLPSYSNQRHNRKMLLSVKSYVRKSPPDIVLYFDRLDGINQGYSDFPLLKLISKVFGSSIWFNAILVMTHASSAIPEGPDGYPISYEILVSRCANIVQHYIHEAVSDNQLKNPILLVENHPLCRTNIEGEKILPDGTLWRNQFLLLCMSSKILADVSKLLKFQDSLKIGHVKTRLPSLPHLLSTFLHPRSMANSNGVYNEMDEFLEIDDKNDDEDNEYDSLPPIRILTKAQFHRLSKDQKNNYLDELDYRETLFLKKQWKEELKRRRESSLKLKSLENSNDDEYDASPDSVPLPEMSIPLSFDPDNPVYRYRCILTNDQWLMRPVLDSQGWDHDVGFDGVNLESAIDIKNNYHASIVGQLSKDKKDFNLQAETTVKYMDPGRSILTSGIDIQTSEKDIVYTIRSDANFKTTNHNITGCGLSVTSFRDMYICGAKIDDSILLWKRLLLGLNMGCMRGCSQLAYGGGLEATIRGKDYPVRDDKTSLALTLISLDKDSVLSGSIQSDFRVDRSSKISLQANLNSRKLGQISLKTSTSEHIEIAFVAIITFARFIFHRRTTDDAEKERPMILMERL